MDGEASSPATATLSKGEWLKMSHSVAKRLVFANELAKTTSFAEILTDFRAQKLQGIDFCSGKWDFPPQKSPAPGVHAAGYDWNSRGLRPSRALRGFFRQSEETAGQQTDGLPFHALMLSDQ